MRKSKREFCIMLADADAMPCTPDQGNAWHDAAHNRSQGSTNQSFCKACLTECSGSLGYLPAHKVWCLPKHQVLGLVKRACTTCVARYAGCPCGLIPSVISSDWGEQLSKLLAGIHKQRSMHFSRQGGLRCWPFPSRGQEEKGISLPCYAALQK